ncbi:MAG: murein biosynthesis integral membrane protein MurJ [Deltaproteobacteria bacterium]|nr:murein biosynthesis integral membrane protein MurJ [Deltaproteobacteria bacterium]
MDRKSETPAEAVIARPRKLSQNPSRVAGSAGIVALAVMVSRIFGLVREQVFAAFFGASLGYDAFLMAFRIPNLLRDLFAEGALSAAFVTTFSQQMAKKGEAAAWRLASLVLNVLTLLLLPLTVMGIIFSRQLVDWIAPGFRFIPGKSELAAEMTSIMCPFILLVALATVAMGILNTKERFGVPASASTFFNVGSIVGGLAFAYAIDPQFGDRAIIGMAIGTLIGGMLQFLVQLPSVGRVGFRYRPVADFTDPGLIQIMRLMAPAVIGTAAVQINVLVNSVFASYLGNGPVSWLGYAFRFMQFPIGVFGVAIGTATLPVLSRAAARRDDAGFRETLASSLGMVFLFCVPSAFGLAVLGEPIVSLIYERGQFTAIDTHQTAAALSFYAIGLTGYAAIKILAPAFYALDDGRTPMIVSVLSIITNTLLNYLLVEPFGHRGLAMATSGVALINFLALLALMRRKIGRIGGRRVLQSLCKVLLASTAMAAVCWIVFATIAPLGKPGLGGQLLSALAPITAGAATFFLIARLLAVPELASAQHALFLRLFRRG